MVSIIVMFIVVVGDGYICYIYNIYIFDKNLKIKTYKTIILSVVFVGVKLCLLH
jgi:hypothetical protein